MNPRSTPVKNNLLDKIHDRDWFQKIQQVSSFLSSMQTAFDKAMPKDLLDIYHVLEIKDNELIIRQYDGIIVTRQLQYTKEFLELPLKDFKQW